MDLLQEISTLSVLAVSIEITKRVEVRKVIGFVVHFLPAGLFAYPSRPLVDAALDLMTTYIQPIKIQARTGTFDLTTVSTRAMAGNGIGSKY